MGLPEGGRSPVEDFAEGLKSVLNLVKGKEENIKTISVRFGHSEGDKSYDYKLSPAIEEEDIRVGQRLVVQVGQNQSASVAVVTTKVHDEVSEKATLWAFQLVDEAENSSLPRG